MDEKFLEVIIKSLEKDRSNFNKDELEKLVRSNDPNDKETLNSTVIDILESDDTSAIEILRKNQLRFNVNSKDYDDKTCLSIAASAGSRKIVKQLLDLMKEADFRKYNSEHLLRLEFPKILPDLWLVEDIIAIVNLLSKTKIILTLEHKLAVLEFLVHNVNDCDCGNSEENSRNLQKNLGDLITYGSAVHVNKVINRIREQIAAQIIQLSDLEFIDYVGKPLSPGVMLKLYVDEGIRKVVDDINGDWENYFPYQLDHSNEYNWMKAHMLQENNKLSLHDVLAKDPRETYHHIYKLDFHQLCKKYKCAGDYMKGLKAKSLIRHQVEVFLPDFMRALFPPLPEFCFNKILHYLLELSNEDILSMSQASCYC